MKKQKAFTLIEVLIALLIIAIALGAAIKATNDSVHTAILVRDDVTAHWVGLNVLSEMQTGIIPAPKAGNNVSGKTKMLNQEWNWDAQSISSSQLSGLTQITIKVNLRNKLITSVEGYV
ncbi:MAG TPA: type II secretion system minor pseudopilin GspI [Coxiellaceae bacterium]|nr:MAG: type II secretion system protein GspI [Gammaproteobacteria bacterium RIFCSPHIGHO2_12_FULL_36_30]HLB56084.1 type II secretion system minor pseudopilin GspI [Coxiellaceae bacterium]